MKQNIKQSLILSVLTILLFGIAYPLVLYGIGKLTPEKSVGSPIYSDGKIVGFENIGQNFTDDKYFNGRPSAVGYNAASTGGSNKGPTNPDYLAELQARIDTFLAHNPDIKKEQIPSELVTASGSGIDPHISPYAAYIQIPRVAKSRNVSEESLRKLVDTYTEKKYLGFLGMERVNVLKINLALNRELQQ